jgi:hypothetical protein
VQFMRRFFWSGRTLLCTRIILTRFYARGIPRNGSRREDRPDAGGTGDAWLALEAPTPQAFHTAARVSRSGTSPRRRHPG